MKNSQKVSKRPIHKVFLPRDLHWKILGKMVDGFEQFLKKEDIDPWRAAVRQRSQASLYTLIEASDPRSMIMKGISKSNFFAIYQLSAFLKKFPFDGDQNLRKAAALKKFYAAEKQCETFNKIGYRALIRADQYDPKLADCISMMRDFIVKVIGERPDIEKILSSSRHGPGSSLCTERTRISPYYKYADLPYSVTSLTLPYAKSLIQSDQRWLGALDDKYRRTKGIPIFAPIDVEDFWNFVFQVINENKVTTVPKTGLTDRTIAIEPRMNVMLQLGVDEVIRKALKRFGCDLDDQRPNQLLAELGSIMEGLGYATLDLSAASDTITLVLIYLLFPPEWIDLLLDLRCASGIVEGRSLEYSKLSSMGNGFTFAVESLVFLAATWVSCEKHNQENWHKPEKQYSLHDDVSVYGDDIILPDDVAPRAISLLQLMGFSLNRDKSFWGEIPFRESCGADFYNGTNVRPLFLTDRITDVKDLYSIINRLRHRGANNPLGPEWAEGVASYLERFLTEEQVKICGPLSDTEFDTYLHVDTTRLKKLGGAYDVSKSLYQFRRLLLIATPQRANQWFFRRLMASHKQSRSRDFFGSNESLASFMKKQEERMLPTWEIHGDQEDSPCQYKVTRRRQQRYRLSETRWTSFWFNSYSDH